MSVRSRRQFLALLVPLLTGPAAAAWAFNGQRFDLQIITADQSKSTALIVEALRARFPTASAANQISKRRPAGKLPIYLAVGPEALRYLATSGASGLIISTFTSYKVCHAIIDKAAWRAGSVSAVYADPSPVQQFRLIEMIFRKPIKVGVILSSDNDHIESVLRRSVTTRQAEVTYETLAPGEDINRVLTRLSDVQAILATPDSAVYNAETIKTILVSTYRRNQAVIGFSAAVVKAGALASTYSDIDDIVAQVDEMLGEYEVTGRLEPQFPKFFDAIVNEDVARSLNIVISDQVPKFSRKPGGKQ
jgi:ABC-type uncharacterized transport system substrate-binding protein